MAYIRSKREERTGYQERHAFMPSIGFQCDFAMVYGTDETMPERIRQFAEAGYLDGFRFLVLSYEMMKPVSPDIHLSLAEWVRSGGCLIYVGDGSDPFHAVCSWWRDAGYAHPAQHLFALLDIDREAGEGTYPFGDGRLTVALPVRAGGGRIPGAGPKRDAGKRRVLAIREPYHAPARPVPDLPGDGGKRERRAPGAGSDPAAAALFAQARHGVRTDLLGVRPGIQHRAADLPERRKGRRRFHRKMIRPAGSADRIAKRHIFTALPPARRAADTRAYP